MVQGGRGIVKWMGIMVRANNIIRAWTFYSRFYRGGYTRGEFLAGTFCKESAYLIQELTLNVTVTLIIPLFTN